MIPEKPGDFIFLWTRSFHPTLSSTSKLEKLTTFFKYRSWFRVYCPIVGGFLSECVPCSFIKQRPNSHSIFNQYIQSWSTNTSTYSLLFIFVVPHQHFVHGIHTMLTYSGFLPPDLVSRSRSHCKSPGPLILHFILLIKCVVNESVQLSTRTMKVISWHSHHCTLLMGDYWRQQEGERH